MGTRMWKLPVGADTDHPDVRQAADLLKRGLTVAFPTETVYGLGADARSDEAVARIYEAKGRPSDNPLIVHIAEREQLTAIAARVQPLERRLMDRFWPGPLTVVLPVRPGAVSPLVTAGLATVAVRMPDHPLALALIAASGCPLAAPSANRSGRPSPTTAAHVAGDLDGRIAGIVDGGPTGVGLESTVVQLRGDALYVLRPGGVTLEQLREAAPELEVRAAYELEDAEAAPRSPGMKYAHYAPRGAVTIVQASDPGRLAAWLAEQARLEPSGRIGVLTVDEHLPAVASDAYVTLSLGRLSEPAMLARRLYAALREFDELGAERIYVEALPEDGLGQAVMNRLLKAAQHRIVRLD